MGYSARACRAVRLEQLGDHAAARVARAVAAFTTDDLRNTVDARPHEAALSLVGRAPFHAVGTGLAHQALAQHTDHAVLDRRRVYVGNLVSNLTKTFASYQHDLLMPVSLQLVLEEPRTT